MIMWGCIRLADAIPHDQAPPRTSAGRKAQAGAPSSGSDICRAVASRIS